MGVRGLTTFIAKDPRKYLKDHKLHDTNLVIDGNSLCAQLYVSCAKCNDIFGGDYDKYARCIEQFFAMLAKCNITPIVIFDGGYEKRKLKTVYQRLKSKFNVIRKAHPITSNHSMFPLFVRELFKDVLIKLKVTVVRCNYEGDFDIACVSRKLSCPVLSYDSDFYVFDVQYIPFTTLDLHISKYTCYQKNANGESVNYMHCKLYVIDNFLRRFGGLDKNVIPLMATVLGNDYIRRSYFRKFYDQLKLNRRRSDEHSDQQRTIRAVIEWLRAETFESAIKKILGRMKKNKRHFAARQIENIVRGYVCKDSILFKYLGIDAEENPSTVRINEDDVVSESDSDSDDSDDESNDSDDSENDSDSAEACVEIEKVDNGKFDFANHKWFEKMCRKGDFPSLFIDILNLKIGVYIPQIEYSRSTNSINIILPFLRVFCKILNDQLSGFKYLARNHKCRVKLYRIEASTLDLPKLDQLEKINTKITKSTFFKILNISKSDMKYIELLPDDWKLFFISLVYWSRHSGHVPVTICHISALVLCVINLYVVDSIAGYHRSKQLFTKKYKQKLKIPETPQSHETIDDYTKPVKQYIKKVTQTDTYFFIDAFITNFDMNEKLQANKNLFCIEIVDTFAQFQSLLLHVKYLNALLMYPFVPFDISKFINGTFLYNVYSNLEKRTCVDSYLATLLKNSPSTLQCYRYIVGILNKLIKIDVAATVAKKKRRRKRKNKTTVENADCLAEDSEGSSEDVEDENNIYSVLRNAA